MKTLAMSFLLAALLTTAVGCGAEGSNANAPSTDREGLSSAPSAIEPAAEQPTLTAALDEAKESGRNVLVVYGSKKCPFSRQMEKQTLSDSSVQAAMKEFVVFRAEQGVNAAEFESAWGKQPTPTIVTLNADGKPIGAMLNGVVAKSDFLAYTTWAKTGQGSQPAIQTGGG